MGGVGKKPVYLYRIVKFEHLLQLFQDRELFFSNPRSWDDPYETRLSHPAFDSAAAECWCKHSVSDAMWRIYSPHQLGVRIKTTRAILTEQLRSAIVGKGRYSHRIADVTYIPQAEINKRLLLLEKKLVLDNEPTRALAPLFWKRRAFLHEAEVRAVVYDKKAKQPISNARIPVDPHRLVGSILIDPRAPDEIVSMYTHYLRMKVKFKGRVGKSELYSREPLHPHLRAGHQVHD